MKIKQKKRDFLLFVNTESGYYKILQRQYWKKVNFQKRTDSDYTYFEKGLF